MNVPIDACENGNAAFTLRIGYDGKCYPGNLGTGGHFPATAACVVYQPVPADALDGELRATYGNRRGYTCTITSVTKDNLVLELYSFV